MTDFSGDDTYLQPARQRLIAKYQLKFVDGRAPVHKRVLKKYLLQPMHFADVGIRLVAKRLNSKKIAERGYWEFFIPQIGAKPIAKEKDL